ncbi:helix-turn-helix transcriptional regulator [Sphingomonas sp. PB1R3]|uniref:helix-turn-helix transcriptional regulator n=1 Tax=Sphingomonas flavida TaxID=3096154 RepID=UPI002FC7B461
MENPRFLREADAAAYLGLSPKTLSRWRWAQCGPTFRRFGTSIRYAIEDLEAFIANAEVTR